MVDPLNPRSAELRGRDSPSTPLLEQGDTPTLEETSPLIAEARMGSRYRILRLLSVPVTDQQGSPKSVAVGLAVLGAIGSLIGMLMPKSEVLPSNWYRPISSCIGYTYFLCWSVSFYPQVYANYRRRSTVGLSVDFAALNVLGFACYASYNIAMYSSPFIHKLYRQRNGENAEITVQPNDVAFAVHALVLASITLFQIGYYNGMMARRPSKTIMIVISGILVAALLFPTLIVAGFPGCNWLDYLYLLSSMKIMVTLIKYIPQALLNYRRKSTVGWSIWQILLDFSGGVLSDLQLVLDSAFLHDWSGITGNLAKFFLGFVSIVFDILFMLQHYVFYPDRATVVEAREKRDEDTPVESEV